MKISFCLFAVLAALTVFSASAADFDGDGYDDVAVFRPSTGLWAIRGGARTYFGTDGDIPVPGKYLYTNRDSIAIYRPSTGLWAVEGSPDRRYFGVDGDIPIGGCGGASGGGDSPWYQIDGNIFYPNGYVGIGTSPRFNLDIYRNTSYWAYMRFTNATTGTADGNGVLVGIDPYEDFRIHSYENNRIKMFTNGTERLRISATGQVGIGTGDDDPHNLLHVRESSSSMWPVLFENQYDNYLSSVLQLTINRATPGTQNHYLTCKNGSAVTVGAIRGNGAGGVTFYSPSADFAEYLPRLDTSEDIEPGDLVAILGGRITKDTGRADQVQVVSTGPIVSGNFPGEEMENLYEKVAFLGRAPAKVRGRVRLGDYIIPSGLNDGVGVAIAPDKLTSAQYSRIVGQAWEASEEEGVKMIDTSVGLQSPSFFQLALQEKDEQIARLSERLEALERLVKE